MPKISFKHGVIRPLRGKDGAVSNRQSLQVDRYTATSLWTMNQNIVSSRKGTGLVWGPSGAFYHHFHFALWRSGCTRTRNAGILAIPAVLKHACVVSSGQAMDRCYPIELSKRDLMYHEALLWCLNTRSRSGTPSWFTSSCWTRQECCL